jgi:hypothetical protein
MDQNPRQGDARDTETEGTEQDTDLSDLLEELRVLLPGTTTLTAFLIILPFNAGFDEIRDEEKAVYIVTFLCSLVALMLFTAPAAHHRLQGPLRDRVAFKNLTTRFMIAGLVPLSIALVLAAQLVLSTVIGNRTLTLTTTGALAILVLLLWWVFPLRSRHKSRTSG